MAAHASLSASQTKQWSTCSGSKAYTEAHPELCGGSGYHAQMGTCAHALVERCLAEGSAPADYSGRLIVIVEGENGDEGTSILKKGAKWPKAATAIVFEVDQDMVEAVECMTDYVGRRCMELGLIPEEADAGGFIPEEVAVLVKKGIVRLESHVVPLPERDDTGGTGDVIIDAWPEILEVIDYKHGAGVFVPVEKNQQLRSYGLGALHEVGAADYEKVVYTICQPRHIRAPRDGIMSEETTVDELMEWKVWLAKKAGRVDEARARVKEGAPLQDLYDEGFLSVGKDGSHCTFCEIKTQCPAVLAKAQETALMDFDDDPDHFDDEIPGDNRLAAVLPWVPFLTKWLKAVTEAAETKLLNGEKIEGKKIVRKQSKRGWISIRRIASEKEGVEAEVLQVSQDDIVTELMKDFGLSKKDIFVSPEPKIKTGPQVEKLVPKADRQKFNDRLLVKPPGGLTMADEDDKRPAVDLNPADDFDNIKD